MFSQLPQTLFEDHNIEEDFRALKASLLSDARNPLAKALYDQLNITLAPRDVKSWPIQFIRFFYLYLAVEKAYLIDKDKFSETIQKQLGKVFYYFFIFMHQFYFYIRACFDFELAKPIREKLYQEMNAGKVEQRTAKTFEQFITDYEQMFEQHNQPLDRKNPSPAYVKFVFSDAATSYRRAYPFKRGAKLGLASAFWCLVKPSTSNWLKPEARELIDGMTNLPGRQCNYQKRYEAVVRIVGLFPIWPVVQEFKLTSEPVALRKALMTLYFDLLHTLLYDQDGSFLFNIAKAADSDQASKGTAAAAAAGAAVRTPPPIPAPYVPPRSASASSSVSGAGAAASEMPTTVAVAATAMPATAGWESQKKLDEIKVRAKHCVNYQVCSNKRNDDTGQITDKMGIVKPDVSQVAQCTKCTRFVCSVCYEQKQAWNHKPEDEYCRHPDVFQPLGAASAAVAAVAVVEENCSPQAMDAMAQQLQTQFPLSARVTPIRKVELPQYGNMTVDPSTGQQMAILYRREEEANYAQTDDDGNPLGSSPDVAGLVLVDKGHRTCVSCKKNIESGKGKKCGMHQQHGAHVECIRVAVPLGQTLRCPVAGCATVLL